MSAQIEGTLTGIPYFTSASDSIYHLKIALLTERVPSAMAKSKALQSNLDVDYVISYRFAKTGMFVCVVGEG
jgi:anoctamin-10